MKLAGAFWSVAGVWLYSATQVLASLPAVQARIDTARVTLGDPIQLSLHLHHRESEKPALPSLAKLLADFSVQPGGRKESKPAAGEVETVLHYELRIYELGTHRIPALPLSFIQAAGDTLLRTTEPVDIEVLSVRQDGEVELRDINPPAKIPGGIPLWLAGMLAALVLVAIVAGLLWALNRRNKRPQVEPPPPPVDYAAEFVRIADMGLLERGDFKTYYSLLSETLWRYLEESLVIEAMEQTTTEITRALRQGGTERSIVRHVEDFLAAADLVKFARFVPELESARRAPEAGMAIVRAVEAIAAEKEELEPLTARPVS